MNFLVVGAGALGSGLSVFLQNGGHEVTLFDAHKRKLDQIKDHGLILYLPDGSKKRAKVPAIAHYHLASRPDYILLTVKTAEVAGALAALEKQFHPLPPVVFFQNGLKAIEKEISESLKDSAVFAVIPHYLMSVSLFEIRLGDGTPELYLKNESPHAQTLQALFQACGFEHCRVLEPHDFLKRQWLQLMAACSLEPVGAMMGSNMRETLKSPSQRRVLEGLAREIYVLAQKQGVFEEPEEEILRVFFQGLDSRASMIRIAMAQDLESKKETEIEDTVGWVLKQGTAINLNLSALQSLYLLIKAREELILAHKKS